MPNERDSRENEPKIKVIDRRLLNEDERAGRAPVPSAPTGGASGAEADAPRIQVTGFKQSAPAAPQPDPEGHAEHVHVHGPDCDHDHDHEDFGEEEEAELTEAEAEELRNQIEEEQFAAYSQQLGRPLTDAEKDQVRKLMDKQMQSMTSLEVSPVLLQTISDLSRYASVHLGLVQNPYTRLIARNDKEARLAIDAFGAIYEVIKTRADPRVGAELARLLNDLRVNYTRITGASFATPATGPRIIR